MKRLFVTVVLLAAVAGCTPKSGTLGDAPSGAPPTSAGASPSGTSGETPSAAATGSAGPTRPAGTLTISLWLVHAGKLAYTQRTSPATQETSQLALTELTSGPTTVESSAGLTTGFPGGTTFRIAGISNGVETVSFSPGFYDGGRDAARLRQAQVVYTLTQFSTVTKVAFQRDGEALAAPVGRADYTDLLPAIAVTSPVIGQRRGSPITVAGTADVFEATVNIRVLDAAGKPIATTFTTATCGSGCRGSFSVRVSYRVGHDQAGVVEVFWISPNDSSHQDVVRIPVTLLA
ncbi:MAG: spore gernimation protein [Hamadaea sp.]|uniref:Gmad2 immunoglobulin-like domain-containing protein n=1 Tax=Hamadaea sp. TaxID=2024425 RepID=UPI00179FAF9C|nr:Gmad2 immunoglobulin-like domain-containing protein [Hamadaea sp.]NUR70831.1 spore gernimation protein [Hamadaea sp.]NUT19937.1 spore gernimation protein [Hamadaea sp.]